MKLKIYPLIFALLITYSISAQNQPMLNQVQIDQLKKSGQLPVNYQVKNPSHAGTIIYPRIQPSSNHVNTNSACNCLIPLDGTFSVAQFDGSGASGGPGVTPDYRNDDWSTLQIMLPFTFCYFGAQLSSLYINNNGNVSFINPYSTYSPNGFPDPDYMMIAPFWADVDTRGALSGLVYYKITTTYMVIKWEHVGYFSQRDSLLNTFQLIITDGSDPIIPYGNVSFCYGDMQWTTGDASQGINGFGGIPATVGANAGNGADYFQLGRFDQPGTAYDGPYGGNDSLDFLDSLNIVFDLCPANVPPIPLDCFNDTVYMRVGDILDVNYSFISPEPGQQTTITVNPGGLANFTVISNNPGDLASYHGRIVADASNLGYNSITVTATDNGTSPQMISYSRVYFIDTPLGISTLESASVSLFPNPMTDEAILTLPGINSKDYTLTINDFSGREVFKKENISSSTTIRKSDLKQGFYIYRVTGKDGFLKTGKLMVN